MAGILNLLGTALQISLERPYFLFPIFFLEEFGLPFPWILSGLFIYVGYRLSLGDVGPLWLVAVNVAGNMIGASGVYWLSRRGLLQVLHRLSRHIRSSEAPLARLQSRMQRWGLLAVLIGRMLPIPIPFTSVASGVLRLPYPGFLLFVAVSTFLWNAFYITAGLTTGQALRVFLYSWGKPAYLTIILAIGLMAIFLFAVVMLRRRVKARS